VVVDPSAIRVQRQGTRRVAVRPAHVDAEGDRLTIRINVMQGPHRAPLWPGRWIVTIGRDATGASIPLKVPAGLELGEARRSFAVGRRGEYVVEPQRDPGGRLAFHVDVVPSPPGGAAAPPPQEGDPGDEAAGEATTPSEEPVVRRNPAVALARRLVGRARSALFQLAFNGFRLAARRNGRRILFTSDSRAELGGNLKLVHDRLVERGLDRKYELMQLFKPGIATGRSWRDRFRLPWLLARADMVLLDDYQPAIYKVTDRKIRIIQLWHAYGSFKTVGYSRVGRQGGADPWSRAHKNYTFAVVGSHNDVPHYAEAFGIREEQVVPTGLPRMDQFLDGIRDGPKREKLLSAFPEARECRTILFAPTFRGPGARGAYYDVGRLDWRALHELCLEKDAVFIVRLHPFVREPPAIPRKFRDRIIDGSARQAETNDLLPGVDVLITDYSSIIYEYSLLGRPMLFYAYDLEDYIASRDFYVRYEDFVPGRIVRTFPELVDAIRREDFGIERVAAFVARSFDHLDGKSTDRIIDQLILAG
jgi:CDP-ribitol ribitolphosphotransferase / teichoic acid ribitol-phosphate polymerase